VIALTATTQEALLVRYDIKRRGNVKQKAKVFTFAWHLPVSEQ